MSEPREFQTVFDRPLGIHIKYWATLVLLIQLMFILVEISFEGVTVGYHLQSVSILIKVINREVKEVV